MKIADFHIPVSINFSLLRLQNYITSRFCCQSFLFLFSPYLLVGATLSRDLHLRLSSCDFEIVLPKPTFLLTFRQTYGKLKISCIGGKVQSLNRCHSKRNEGYCSLCPKKISTLN